MNHYNQETWLAYLNNELPENQHEEIENHLYSCDHCLEHYMQLLDDTAVDFPESQADNTFTEEILRQLPFESKKKRTFTQHPLFHYGVAAAVTVVLMSSGFFQNLTGVVTTVEAATIQTHEEPVSNSLMNKILSLLEIFEEKQKEGDSHE